MNKLSYLKFAVGLSCTFAGLAVGVTTTILIFISEIVLVKYKSKKLNGGR